MTTSLTPEQIALFPEYVERWTAIGLATEKPGFDHGPAENAVKLAYKCAGLPEPTKFIWTESPLHTGLAYAALKDSSVRSAVASSVRSSVASSVDSSVDSSVRSAVASSVYSSVASSVDSSVYSSVDSSVYSSVDSSVRSAVASSVRSSVASSVYSSVASSVYSSVASSVASAFRSAVASSCCGSHDSSWLSFYAYFHEQGLVDCSKLAGLWECAKHCGWFMPFKDTVIISPRPYVCKTRKNERGIHELHADGEPAVFYCEDFKIYANGGIRLPEKYGSVKTKDWQSKWLLEEKNAELKMCLIKNIGYDKILHELEAKKLDAWREYELLRIDNVDVEPVVLLKMICPSTGHIHVGRVPPDTTKARAAATLRNHGLDPESFIVEH